MSHAHGCIIGGEHPKHFIPIEDMTKEKVEEILDGKSDIHGNISIASEVKVTVMSFQDTPRGIPVMEVVAGRPQSNNESNDFIKEMEAVASVASVQAGGRFTNFTVDGVSCESTHVWLTICMFLSSKCNHLGSTDPNHNAKSWRYQIIASGGDESVSLGDYMLDTYIFRMANIAMGIYRPNDFASDRLLLELVSFESISKIALVEDDSAPSENKAVLALALFFVRLSLYLVNGKQVPATHRAVFVW